MKKFQEMCQDEFNKVSLLARGGQKIVFDALHKNYGNCFVILFFILGDPRSLR